MARLTLYWLPGGEVYVKPKERSISSLRFSVRRSAAEPGLWLRCADPSRLLCTCFSATELLCFIRVLLTAHVSTFIWFSRCVHGTAVKTATC